MFARLLTIAAVAAFVAAQECSTGTITCCASPIMEAAQAHSVLKQVGINVLEGVTEPVAFSCGSGGLVGVGNSGATCTQAPICCNQNEFGGLISVGCSPIGVNI